jgi:hypothetical protein
MTTAEREICRMMTRSERTKALGHWGELKAMALLRGANFINIRDLNTPTRNHQFGDVLAEQNGVRYMIGVKTRNKFQESGSLNAQYNMRKPGVDVGGIAERYKALPAWVTVQVIAELQTFSAYFGTDLTDLNWISMQERHTRSYVCLASDQFDETIRPDWTNRR